nr:PCYCGC domain-containing protein [Marininema mesophilum]
MVKRFGVRSIGWLLVPALVGATIIVGCQNNQPKKESMKESHQQHEVNGDIREATAGKEHLPSFLNETNSDVKRVYRLAAKHAKTLEKMPCYCGCGESVGHKNNLDCFVHELKKDGKITWDSHGTKCSTCLDVAVKTAELKEKGKSDLEIRKYLDNQYKDSNGKPTPTPMPAS